MAPELLMSPDNLTLECDKWSFGATLWELFNNGKNPLLNWDLDMVLPLPPWCCCNLSRTFVDICGAGVHPDQGLFVGFFLQKQKFYESFQQLPPSQWTELADLINQCMDYQADFRPSYRSIIRQLNSLITSGSQCATS